MKRIVALLLLCLGWQLGCVDIRPPGGRVDESSCHAPPVVLADYLKTQEVAGLQSVRIWPNRFGPGLCLETRHYRILTTLSDPFFLSRLPNFVEAAHRSYNEQLPVAVSPETRSTLYLFATRAQWEAFTRRFAGRQARLFLKIQEGAYCLNGRCVVYDIGPERTLSAIGHEGWHQFTSRHFKNRLPSWLDEGIAMQFENPATLDGQLSFDPCDNHFRLHSLERVVKNRHHLPLVDLLTVSPGEVMALDSDDSVTAFYSQSYALVRFLQEADNGRYLARYRAMLDGGLLGTWPLSKKCRRIAADRNRARTVRWNSQVGRQIFTHYVHPDPQGLESEYFDFCDRIIAGQQ